MSNDNVKVLWETFHVLDHSDDTPLRFHFVQFNSTHDDRGSLCA